MDRITELIKKDPMRMSLLECVSSLKLPQCFIAAGFVRNLVWDTLHEVATPTPLNDVDVVYFERDEPHSKIYLDYETRLAACMPEFNWQVRNQAHMHQRNGDRPYKSTVDAMSFWPEKETAVGVRQVGQNQYECVSAFGFDSLFEFSITRNPKRSREIFEHRVNSKGWLVQWPHLKVVR